MSLLDAAVSFVGGGGLATALGTIVGAVAKYKERQLEQRHELAMAPHRERQWDFELEQLQRQAERDREMAEFGLLIETERGANELLDSAIDAEAMDAAAAMRVDGMPWQIPAFKTLFRPLLTLALWTLVLILWHRSAPGSDIEALAVSTVMQGAAASLGLWFGSRLVNAPRTPARGRL